MTMEGFNAPKAPKLENQVELKLVPTEQEEKKEKYEKLVSDLTKAQQVVVDLERIRHDIEINGTPAERETIPALEQRIENWKKNVEEAREYARQINPDYSEQAEIEPNTTIH